jgi:hypothetical protein
MVAVLGSRLQREPPGPGQELFERHSCLHPRQRRTDAQVRTPSEADMLARVGAFDVDHLPPELGAPVGRRTTLR